MNIKLPAWRYVEIEDLASTILLNHTDLTLPFNPESIAKSLGIVTIDIGDLKLSREELKDKLANNSAFCDGFCVQMLDQKLIFTNNSWFPLARDRYTFGHEIGHLELGHTQESDLSEIEANVFSRSLLSPFGIAMTFSEEQLTPNYFMDAFGLSMKAAYYAVKRTRNRKNYEDEVSETTIRLRNAFLEKEGGVM